MSPEISMGARAFADWVNPETAKMAGIEYKVTRAFYSKGASCQIFSGFVPGQKEERSGLHLVVGEMLRRKSRTWFFGTFEGPAWASMDPQEAEIYLAVERNLLQGQNMVLPSNLGNLIRQAVNGYLGNVPPGAQGQRLTGS